MGHNGPTVQENGGMITFGGLDTVNCAPQVDYVNLISATYFMFKMTGYRQKNFFPITFLNYTSSNIKFSTLVITVCFVPKMIHYIFHHSNFFKSNNRQLRKSSTSIVPFKNFIICPL